MKSHFLFLALVALLSGCSSSVQETDSQYSTMTGGGSAGDTVSLYWYTEKQGRPYSAAEYVKSANNSWYQTDYLWRDKELWEVIREGVNGDTPEGAVPFSLQLRFDAQGEAVYQQYRVGSKVLPMNREAIMTIQSNANRIMAKTKEQRRTNRKLIQGYWDGTEFQTCDGSVYSHMQFSEDLPKVLLHRLETIDSYAAFVGSVAGNKIQVLELLLLDDDSHDCIERPDLISD